MRNNVQEIEQILAEGHYIDWEWVLEYNYIILLDDIKPLSIIDIGANMGRHAQVFTEILKCGYLMMFEPIPHLCADLQAIFSDKPVDVFQCALGAREGSSSFFVKPAAIGESGLRRRSSYNDGRSDDLEEIVVQVRTLDSFDPPGPISYIKIDTEGGEIDILKGAAKLLKRDRPAISVEFGRGGYDAYGYGPEALFSVASELGYAIFDLVGTPFVTQQDWLNGVDRIYWDYLMLPMERADWFRPKIERIRSSVVNELRRGILDSQRNAGG